MTPSGTTSFVVPAGEVDAHIRCGSIVDGDFHLETPRAALEHRRRSFMSGVWTQLDEVHGNLVRRVRTAGEFDGSVGDALVTDLVGAVLSVWVGDCAPVVLVAADGTVAAVHAGWRGALGGVLEATVAEMRATTAAPIGAFLGPCIHACCYEFGAADLATCVERFGPSVASNTSWGSVALDMPTVVRSALAPYGISVRDLGGCTGCHPLQWFSHRRGQRGRQVMAVCARKRQ